VIDYLVGASRDTSSGGGARELVGIPQETAYTSGLYQSLGLCHRFNLAPCGVRQSYQFLLGITIQRRFSSALGTYVWPGATNSNPVAVLTYVCGSHIVLVAKDQRIRLTSEGRPKRFHHPKNCQIPSVDGIKETIHRVERFHFFRPYIFLEGFQNDLFHRVCFRKGYLAYQSSRNTLRQDLDNSIDVCRVSSENQMSLRIHSKQLVQHLNLLLQELAVTFAVLALVMQLCPFST
jgi:hypothetical protein